MCWRGRDKKVLHQDKSEGRFVWANKFFFGSQTLLAAAVEMG
jgi:hypothetical protein